MATRNSLCKKTVDVDKGEVAFAFTNGETVVFSLASLDEAGLRRAALHGISQKGGDSYAGVKSADDAQKSLVATLEAVEKGDWTVRTAGEPRTLVLVMALVRATKNAGAPKTQEECQALIDTIKADPDEEVVKAKLKKLNADPAIKLAKKELEHEKAMEEAQKSESALGGLFA